MLSEICIRDNMYVWRVITETGGGALSPVSSALPWQCLGLEEKVWALSVLSQCKCPKRSNVFAHVADMGKAMERAGYFSFWAEGRVIEN